jgi:GNAT superfamily N-acetyltransferase
MSPTLRLAMDLQQFARYHLPALEPDEVRYNVQIAVLSAAATAASALQYWTLGGPGHCATRSPGHGILLGGLDRAECEALALQTRGIDYPGVIGSDEKAPWFVDAARAIGLTFAEAVPQRIHVLRGGPRYPGAEGSARGVAADDTPLLFDWIRGFHREAVPHEPAPQLGDVEKAAASGRFLFWMVAGEPVSVAAVARRLKTTAAISSVYTPPDKRGRGYAGSVTAAVAERAFAEGKASVCLYTDLTNPFSNRCYAKIGFTPYCDSWHYLRLAARADAMTGPAITLRAATIEDLAFASRLYLETMRYITDRLPDFDEARHMANFAERFLPDEVQIIVESNTDIGWLQVRETEEEIFLKQMFLQPAAQGRGIGSRLLADLIARGRPANKPVRLGVVKINPAVRLYRRFGFAITSEDDFKYYMEKRPE